MLGSAFNRMDLVTREEFDIQQVLIKTRTKLAELEERLARLELNSGPIEGAGANSGDDAPEPTE